MLFDTCATLVVTFLIQCRGRQLLPAAAVVIKMKVEAACVRFLYIYTYIYISLKMAVSSGDLDPLKLIPSVGFTSHGF